MTRSGFGGELVTGAGAGAGAGTVVAVTGGRAGAGAVTAEAGRICTACGGGNSADGRSAENAAIGRVDAGVGAVACTTGVCAAAR